MPHSPSCSCRQPFAESRWELTESLIADEMDELVRVHRQRRAYGSVLRVRTTTHGDAWSGLGDVADVTQSVSGVKEIVLDLLGRDTEEGGELGDLRHHAIDGFLAHFGIAGARRNGPCRHRGRPCRIRRGCKRRAGRIRPRRAGSGWGERRSGPWRQSVPQHPPMQIGPMEVDNRSRFGCTVVLLGKGDAQWRLQFYCPSRSW